MTKKQIVFVGTICMSLIAVALWHNRPVPVCEIIGDHEYYTPGVSRCIPYCPPNPSECQ
jgi:hypothetical protein